MWQIDTMESIREVVEKKLHSWHKVAWSNEDIKICLEVGTTKASELHRMAIIKNKGIIRALKNKVKSDSVCELLGIDRKQEITKLLDSLELIKERTKENEERKTNN